jgi:hypothetical protein
VVVAVPPTQMPVEMYCSADGREVIGTTLSQSPDAMNYYFTNEAGQEACRFTEPHARSDIINTSRVNISNLADKCPNLGTGKYVITMRPYAQGASLLMTLVGAEDWFTVQALNWIGKPLHVNITRSLDRSVTMVAADKAPCDTLQPGTLSGDILENMAMCLADYGPLAAKVLWTGTPGAQRCDHGVSPLILQLSDTVEPITLTPPLDGVQFDIRGSNAKPAYAPMTISWLTAESAPQNYFLVLPDAAGEVRGIDQMFGDNTLGPDNSTPAALADPRKRNGYEALRKWDERADGFITAQDPVFARLRLWRDANHDGIVDRAELSTLDDHHVMSIDLNADHRYEEVDPYGNSTKLKSVVKTSDGRLHLIYDLWFRALPGRSAGV